MGDPVGDSWIYESNLNCIIFHWFPWLNRPNNLQRRLSFDLARPRRHLSISFFEFRFPGVRACKKWAMQCCNAFKNWLSTMHQKACHYPHVIVQKGAKGDPEVAWILQPYSRSLGPASYTTMSRELEFWIPPTDFALHSKSFRPLFGLLWTFMKTDIEQSSEACLLLFLHRVLA